MQVLGGCIDARSRRIAAIGLPVLTFGLQAALAGPALADTRAATTISNVATATATLGAGVETIRSNPVVLIVGERLDVALARIDDDRIDVRPGGVAVPVLLANRGNGAEAFDVAATPSDASVGVRLIAIDRDGNGRYDPAIDQVLANGRTATLEAGATLCLLVMVDPAATTVTATSLTVIARATTGNGPDGTLFAGRGDAGTDAVTGPTEAQADITVPFGDAAAAEPTLRKSQSVRAPDGSSTPASGAIVTYRLEARFPGATAAARIDDPVPQGTLYVPGSLKLDGVSISDAADDDVGQADDAAIAVALGDIARATTRIVQFQVTIQ